MEHKVPKAQADAHAQLIAKAVGQSAASKDDLRHTEMKLKSEIKRVESELKGEIQEIRTLIADQRSELLKWMFTMLMAQAGLVITVIKFL